MAKEYNEPSSGIKKIENDTLEIEFRNVSFKYPNTDKWIIKNLNMKINKKEKLAIVGINGAGKTTLVKLILRFFNPTEGEILINGTNIKDFALEEYYQMFSVVFQEINILAYTIRENITFGLSNDEARIWDCLERVGLKDKILNFDQGLDQMMLKVIDEKGVMLSGGENQKLAIARALYKNGNAVILDEPTAALDALAEADIYQSFNDLVKDKTAIYISHRLASTKFCDHIALFKDSSLLEYGTHEELMKLKGEYYHMFVVQGKYYQEENNHA
jgi:ABC-type multidrug transport system fused ATPase/permease subunit